MATAKKIARKTVRKASVKRAPQTRRPGALSSKETTPLLLQAKEAYKYQLALKRVEPGMSFDEWRRDQVMDTVDREGISKIDRSQWTDVMVHFLILSGKDAEAFALQLKSGTKTYRPEGPDDTHEKCRTYVYLIRKAIADHLARTLPEGVEYIREGWLLAAARPRSSKPGLTMENMAGRLGPKVLLGLLAHVNSHINEREGKATDKRKPRRYAPRPKDEPIINPASEIGDDEPG